MTPKSLAALRAHWRRKALKNYCQRVPTMLVAAVLGAAMVRAMLANVSATEIPGSPVLTYVLTAPYFAYDVGCILLGAVVIVPLVLTCLGPYPSKEAFELKEQIRQARAAGRAGGAQER